MDPHRPGQCPTYARLGDEAHRFDDAQAMVFALCCVIGDEGGPDQVGGIRDYTGEGLAECIGGALIHITDNGKIWVEEKKTLLTEGHQFREVTI
jgi:hypothetical protein